jgi:hypothetical protein
LLKSLTYYGCCKLPDIYTKSLENLNLNINVISAIYPDINKYTTTKERIQYIQKVNTKIGIKQCKEWLDSVNHDNIFLQIYEKKIMNPINFIDLKNNEKLDCNLFAENYLKYL